MKRPPLEQVSHLGEQAFAPRPSAAKVLPRVRWIVRTEISVALPQDADFVWNTACAVCA